MSAPVTSLERLFDPVAPGDFFATHFGRRPLHIPGRADKFASVMSWDDLNRILGMDVWDANTLHLVLDKQRVPPAAYSQTILNRNQRQVLQPDAGRVMDLLRRGASLVLNNIETLHPGALAVAETIGSRLGAKVSANLYCSWQQRPAFDSHYDRHDVFALHVVGEKIWRVYEGRLDNPVEHAAFYNIPQSECDRLKGRVAQEVTMRPGDLLYLPRGQFHDALASSAASIHVTFGCGQPTGLDWLTHLWERAVHDPRFRADLPPAGDAAGEAALHAHVETLTQAVRDLALNPPGPAAAAAFRRGFGVKRHLFDLPNLIPKPPTRS
jgi:ribosomal protein L16 Arg81 hydroxylase